MRLVVIIILAQDIDLWLVRDPASFRNDDSGVWFGPARCLPRINLPGFHASNLGSDCARVAAASI